MQHCRREGSSYHLPSNTGAANGVWPNDHGLDLDPVHLNVLHAQGLSNIAWAMATANSPQPRLFEALSRTATALAPTFNAQNCSVTLWSCAALRHYDAQLFDALLARLVDCGNGVQAAPSPPAAPCGHSTSSRRPSVAGGRISSGSGNGGGMPGVGQAERDACEPQNVANALWAVAR